MKRISELTREELIAEVLTDPLTGIGNRRAFDEVEANGPAVMYAYVDLDGLKWVNDNAGHAMGDAFLRLASTLLRRLGVPVYRIGGDEFVLRYKEGFPGLARNDLKQIAEDLPLISWGLGRTQAEADEDLRHQKALREKNGNRVPRGEMPRNLSSVGEQEVG